MLLTFVLALTATKSSQSSLQTFADPAGSQVAKIVYGGVTILPDGRYCTPVGKRQYTGKDLWHVVLGPNGLKVGLSNDTLAVYQNGIRRFIHADNLDPVGRFTNDGKQFVTSWGEKGGLTFWDTADWTVDRHISINTDGYSLGYIDDFVFSADGKLIYCLDVAHEQLDVVDADSGQVLSRTFAGYEPYRLALDSATNRLYWVNFGIFDYSFLKKGISHPAFAFPSKQSEKGTQFENQFVPGIGKASSLNGDSLWSASVADPHQPKILAKVKTGNPIGTNKDWGKVVGGSSPCAVAIEGNRVFVSNANDDTIQDFDADTLRLRKTIRLAPVKALSHLRGVIPSQLVIDPANHTLYVCESGLNAVGVVNLRSDQLVGQIPVGWYPLDIKLNRQTQSLVVATQKGLGHGPQGPLNARSPQDERYDLAPTPGMLETFPVPSQNQLEADTHQTLLNDGLIPNQIPAPKFPKQITRVVYIIKENHTFDGIFGGMPGVNGQPRYAEFGDQGWIREKGTQTRLPIMPNHIKIAEQYAISDNFYLEPHMSGDGHRWDMGVYPSIWTTRLYYKGWNWEPTNKTKGRLVSFGSDASQFPEDYLEHGSIWEQLIRGHVSFRNYGEGFEFPGVDEGEPRTYSRTGAVEHTNIPMPAALFKNTCFQFPIFNEHIPDIAKVKWFEEDVQKTFRSRDAKLPQCTVIALSNDHGDDPRPKEGYPYFCSYLADDDLALGRLVQYLTHTPEWKHMAIFVLEDDCGGDNDHVDRHRSFLLAISPWIKHHYVSHVHTCVMSVLRTIYGIFGLPPNNLFDATAMPLTDMFTTHPDFTPYHAVPVDPRVFQPAATFDPDDPTFQKRWTEQSMEMDNPAFIKKVAEGFILPPKAKGHQDQQKRAN